MTEWTADKPYVMEEAGTVCIISGRSFKKVNAGKALAAYYYKGGYTGPLLVSDDPEAVTYDAGKVHYQNGQIEYMGITWYVSDTGYFMPGNLTSSAGSALKLDGVYTTNTEAALELLRIANVKTKGEAKYLLKIEGIYYDNDMNVIDIEDVTEEALIQYGSSEITTDLSGYDKYEVIKYDKSEEPLPLRVVMKAVPFPQTVRTNAIDLSHETIGGIEGVAVKKEGRPFFSLSFDEGQTWEMHNGKEWVLLSEEATGMQAETVEAIQPEQWQEKIRGIPYMLLRFTLNDESDSVTSVEIDFTRRQI